MTSLADRRKKFDLVQTFKILNGHDCVDSSNWFKTVRDNANRLTRNTAYSNNLVATRSRTDIRKNFFSSRVVNLWNSLPTDVKDARTVKLFKAKKLICNPIYAIRISVGEANSEALIRQAHCSVRTIPTSALWTKRPSADYPTSKQVSKLVLSTKKYK